MRKTYREENNKIIKGIALPVFIHNLDYHLTEIQVFEDGMIDCRELVDFAGFKEKVKSGWIKTTLPKGQDISAFPLGGIKVKEFHANRSEDQLVLEVEDIINKLKGKQTSKEICRKKFDEYVSNPNSSTKEALKIAYEKVPEHNRVFILGSMDVHDIPIRVAIYGEKVFQESFKAQLQEEFIREHFLKGIKIEKNL